MEPGEYVKAVRRRWPAVAAVTLLAAVLGWVTAPSRPPKAQYQATAIIAVRPTTGAAVAVDPTTADIVATQATSTEVAARAKEKLGFKGSPEKLAAQVQTKFDAKGGSVRISSTQSSAAHAIDVANAFTHELLSYRQQRQDSKVQDAVDVASKSLTDLQARSASLDQRIAASTDPVEQAKLKSDHVTIDREIDAALSRLQQFNNLRGPGTARATLVRDALVVKLTPALAPPSSPIGRAAIALAVGLLLGVGLALFLDRLDSTLRTRRQFEAAFGLPVIAEVPWVRAAKNRVDVAVQPRSSLAEAYRKLRTATLVMPVTENGSSPHAQNGSHAAPGGSPEVGPLGSLDDDARSAGAARGRLIVLTSPGSGEGTTSAAVNLAAAFAETGLSVIVAGADLRRPAVAALLGLSETPGITDVLSREPGSDPPRAIRRTSIPGLSVLPSGAEVENPAAMLTRARDLVLQCRSLAEIVIVDTPPMLVANDAVEFLLAADSVILVARCGRTSVEAAQRAAELLRRLKAPVLGVAAIGLPSVAGSSSRYFDSGGPRRSSSAKPRRGAPVTLKV